MKRDSSDPSRLETGSSEGLIKIADIETVLTNLPQPVALLDKTLRLNSGKDVPGACHCSIAKLPVGIATWIHLHDTVKTSQFLFQI